MGAKTGAESSGRTGIGNGNEAGRRGLATMLLLLLLHRLAHGMSYPYHSFL